MRMSVTVEGDTPAELAAGLIEAAEALGKTSTTAKPKANKAAPVDEEEEAPPPKAKAKAKPAPVEEDEGLDYDKDVRPVVLAFNKDFGKEACLELLGQFTNAATDEPCTKGSELSEDDWAAFLAKEKKTRKRLEAE